MEEQDKFVEILRFGESWEKLEAMRELEKLAKECRTRADAVLDRCATAAGKEKNKPWREFRRQTGLGLFNAVLDIAQGPPGSELRNLAADILAHLWHPAAVDRLVEDIKENGETLLNSQYSGIFVNLGGIGNESAARALISLWAEGGEYDIAGPLAACNSKAGDAFLMLQARENKDPAVRGHCICCLSATPTEEKTDFLRERLKNTNHFEQSATVRKIAQMCLVSMAPELIAVYNQSEDPRLKEEIAKTLRSLNGHTGR